MSLKQTQARTLPRRLEQGEGLTSSPTMKYVLAGRAWRRRWRCICQEEVVDSAHNGTHRADREWNVREPKAGCHETGHRGPRLDPACPRGQHIESATIHESGRFLKHATPDSFLHECIKQSQIVSLLARPKICSKGRWHGCWQGALCLFIPESESGRNP